MNIKHLIYSFILLGCVYPGQHMSAQHWAADNMWFFDNFSTGPLTWEQYRRTFIGVSPTAATSGNFDLLLFDNIYEDRLSTLGHCYGMCVMALRMKKYGGQLGYCFPPNVYPGDFTNGPTSPRLLDAIQIMHGYQIGERFLMFLQDRIVNDVSRDGNYALFETDTYLAQEDYPILSITESLNPDDGGHVVVPYAITGSPGDPVRRIMVYDPNRSYFEPGADGRDWYDLGNNFIEVTTATGAWTFDMVGADDYAGSPSSGGNILSIPLSVSGIRDRLPMSLLSTVDLEVAKIFIFGEGASFVSIKDKNGMELYDPVTQSVDPNNPEAQHKLIPFYSFSGQPEEGFKTKLFFVRDLDDLTIETQNGGAGYTLGILGKQGLMTVEVGPGKVSEQIRLRDFHTIEPSMTLEAVDSAASHQIRLAVQPHTGTERIYTVQNLAFQQAQQIRFQVAQGGNALHATTNTVNTAFDLGLETKGPQRCKPIRTRIQLDETESAVIAPARWNSLRPEEVQVLPQSTLPAYQEGALLRTLFPTKDN